MSAPKVKFDEKRTSKRTLNSSPEIPMKTILWRHDDSFPRSYHVLFAPGSTGNDPSSVASQQPAVTVGYGVLLEGGGKRKP
uniref:Uncharacterized protein n=1 Tax=Panagrellus redivivus TaxID=6233 RepID=A0A7E4W195_PANRE